MNRAQKEEQVDGFKSVFAENNLVVVAHYSGMSVAEMSELRGQMREAGASFKVTKNRLVRRAVDGGTYASLADLFVGPTAIAFSVDPVAAARVAVDYAKKNDKLVVLGGAMGETQLDIDGVKALAALPSLDELRGKLVGLLQAPATKVAAVVQAPAAQLARVLQARADQTDAV